MSEQLLYFRDALVDAGYEACPNLKSWREAFRALQKFLEGASDARKVVFIDELPYMRIVEALGRSGRTLTRDEVVRLSGLASGGVFSRYLEDLEECGFVVKIKTFGLEKNGARHRLSDNFTLFHFNFIAHNTDNDETFWTDSRGSGMRRDWVGLAFERVCLAHVQEIKSALGIAGVRTAVSVRSHRADEVYPEGAQIDMVIDRADGIINLCEMKFTGNEFTVDKKYDRELMNKRAVFQSVTETKKAVHLTMVTSSGVVRNAYWNNVQSEVTLDDLFES